MSSQGQVASYGAVFRLPDARVAFGAALVGRLGYGMLGVALLLELSAGGGSLARGGLLATGFGTVSVVLGPARADLVDRWGAGRALPALAAPFAGALLTLACCGRSTNTAVLGLLVAAGGATCPPLGPTMRAVWGALAPQEALLQRAFGLDTVAEEVLFLVGPPLAVALDPARALAVAAVLVAVGACALAAAPATRLLAAGGTGGARPARARSGPLSAGGAGVRRTAVAALAVGVCLGAVDLYVLACARQAHHAGAVGWVLAGQSAGSVVGGLVNGRLRWRRPAPARLPLLLAGLAALLCVDAVAAGSLPWLAGCVAATGTLLAPTLSTAYLAAARTAPEGAAARATGWVNSAVNAGSSAGGALASALVGAHVLPVGFLATGAVVGLCAFGAGERGRNG